MSAQPGELAARARALTAGIDATLEDAAAKDAAVKAVSNVNPFAAKKVAVKAGRRFHGSAAKPKLSIEDCPHRPGAVKSCRRLDSNSTRFFIEFFYGCAAA